jgi:hypothetical protein
VPEESSDRTQANPLALDRDPLTAAAEGPDPVSSTGGVARRQAGGDEGEGENQDELEGGHRNLL